MEEREFLALADAELARVENALERLQAAGSADFDYELAPGGIIEIEFENGSKIVINRHAAAREIWVAARAGGFHFRPPTTPGGRWQATRGDEDLQAALTRCFSAQAGVALRLDW